MNKGSKYFESKTIARTSVMAAIIFISTYLIKIQLPTGYAHLGDGFILSLSFTFGNPAIIASAFGSLLCDVISGYIYYAIPTFVIKGAMAFIVIYFNKRPNDRSLIISFALSELFMICSYFLVDYFLYGHNLAFASIIGNTGQGILGFISAMLLVKAFRRINISKLI